MRERKADERQSTTMRGSEILQVVRAFGSKNIDNDRLRKVTEQFKVDEKSEHTKRRECLESSIKSIFDSVVFLSLQR